MPLPLILLGGAAVIAALYGAKKGIDAYSDHEEAVDFNEDAKMLLLDAEGRLKQEREKCTAQLEELGRLKLDAWDRQLGRFCSLFEHLRNVEVVGDPGVDRVAWSNDELVEMKSLSGYASAVMSGGLAAVGSGALVGLASYGGATMFATASTGTAIGSLSGVAATNATLAWFGGGALSAGGLGMAGGIAVLGGIVTGPVLAVGGAVLAAKARENLAKARTNHALAEELAGEVDTAVTVVEGIRRVASQFAKVISETVERTTSVLDGLAMAIASHGADFTKYPDHAKCDVYLAVQFMQCLKALLEAPILTKDGALDEAHRETLARGRALLVDHAND